MVVKVLEGIAIVLVGSSLSFHDKGAVHSYSMNVSCFNIIIPIELQVNIISVIHIAGDDAIDIDFNSSSKGVVFVSGGAGGSSRCTGFIDYLDQPIFVVPAILPYRIGCEMSSGDEVSVVVINVAIGFVIGDLVSVVEDGVGGLSVFFQSISQKIISEGLTSASLGFRCRGQLVKTIIEVRKRSIDADLGPCGVERGNIVIEIITVGKRREVSG